jgi:predicted dehydrogenase
METERLTAGILGLNDSGQRLLKAAAATGSFQIKAVADEDAQKAEKAAALHHCEAYRDYRQLIVQNQLDCLLVAAEPHACDEHLTAALRKRFHILKVAPPARTAEELLEYVRLADAEGVRFAVANPARFQGSFMAAHEMMAQGRLEHAFLVSARGDFSTDPPSAWQSDPGLAGGGVLLHDCYSLLDQLLWSFPLPEQVYALKTNRAPDKQQRLYLPEDTALVCLRFTEALIGNLVATRSRESGPHRISIEIHAKEARLTVTANQVELTTRNGRGDLKWRYEEDEQVPTERLLSRFARSVLAPAEHPLVSSGADNLRNMAVLESAYLSAKTGVPEEPARILRLAGNPPLPGAAV